jgi:ABC-type Mn2+/Zn2+ transport system ATPase subunit
MRRSSHSAIAVVFLLLHSCQGFLLPTKNRPAPACTALFGKKSARKGGGKKQPQAPQEKQSVKDARFDAATRQYMFTMIGLTKVLPDKSKTLLKNINLSFYPGAKIGVVGLNGSGKSTMLKIMAGVETEFDGTARPLPGASIGYLSQEPELGFDTVQECIDEAVASSQAILDEFNELSMKLGEDLTPDEMEKIMSKTDQLTNQIEAGNLWELDRIVSRAMDSLRVPAGDAKTATLSGGEKRRVALCRLLLANHDMLLLDEPTNHLDAESVTWLEQYLAQFKGTVVCIVRFYCCCFCLTPVITANTIYPSIYLLPLCRHMTGTFWKMLPNGSSSWIVEKAFRSRATIQDGWKPRIIV